MAPTGHGPTSWSSGQGPGQRTPSPSISFLSLPSRPSAFHLVRSRNEINVCGTRSTYEKRDQDLDNEIDVPGTSLSPPSRPSTFHLVPQPSISFVHATRSTCEERGRRARDESRTWATRSTPVLVGSSGRRDQTRPSWRVLVAPRRARGALPPSSCSVTVLCQDVGDTWGVCVGDTSGWPRGWCPPASGPLGPWQSPAWRPWCCHQLVVPPGSYGPGPPLAHRRCPHGGHQPRPPSTPQPTGARSRRTPPRGSNTQAGHVRAVDTRGAGARPPRARTRSSRRCARARAATRAPPVSTRRA